MIICPECQSQQLDGVIFCNNCGALLIYLKETQTTDIRVDSLNDKKINRIAFEIKEKGQVILLPVCEEITIGRSVEGQPFIPDVDFAQFDGYKMGVSRLHAVLKVVEGKLILSDLGSSNGTWVNGKKISQGVDTLIKNGDQLSFGKLKVYIKVDVESGG